jgi:hypothetical protein
MASHTKDALRGPGILQVLNLTLAVAAPKATSAVILIPRQYDQVLDLLVTSCTRVCTA